MFFQNEGPAQVGPLNASSDDGVDRLNQERRAAGRSRFKERPQGRSEAENLRRPGNVRTRRPDCKNWSGGNKAGAAGRAGRSTEDAVIVPGLVPGRTHGFHITSRPYMMRSGYFRKKARILSLG